MEDYSAANKAHAEWAAAQSALRKRLAEEAECERKAWDAAHVAKALHKADAATQERVESLRAQPELEAELESALARIQSEHLAERALHISASLKPQPSAAPKSRHKKGRR